MQNIELAKALYTEFFGEAATNRNAARVSKLAEIITNYGPAVKLETLTFSWTQEKMQLLRQHGEFVLGTTTTNSRGAGNMVIAVAADEDIQSDKPTAPHMA